MGYIKINGDIDVARINLRNTTIPEDNEDGSNSYLTYIQNLGLNDDVWNANDNVVLANMNNSIAGNGADYGFKDIIYFKVYKTIGKNNTKLYHIYNTKNLAETKIKDYIVGDDCSYRYYIYPVCSKVLNGVTVETISQPFSSNEMVINDRVLSIVGLEPLSEEEAKQYSDNSDNVYRVGKNNIWLLSLNLKDSGTVLNTNKVFSDTLNRYRQETGTSRSYKTKNVTSLLGKIDCASMKYVDTFEKLEAWDEFCRNSSLKALVDIRGRIMIGDIDNNPTIEYGTTFNKEANVSFAFTELTDIDNIIIIGESIG